MRRFPAPSLLALSLIAACGGGGAAPEAPSPRTATSAAISPADLRARMSVFAHDSMAGRQTGTPGNAKGNAYIAAEVARLGLKPAGDSGTFLQRVPLTRYTIAACEGTIRDGGAELKSFQD